MVKWLAAWITGSCAQRRSRRRRRRTTASHNMLTIQQLYCTCFNFIAVLFLFLSSPWGSVYRFLHSIQLLNTMPCSLGLQHIYLILDMHKEQRKGMRRAKETPAINPRHFTQRPQTWGANCHTRTNLPFEKRPIWA